MSISFLILELRQFSFIRDLTRKPGFGNTPFWVLPNIWSLGQVGNTKFGTNASNKILVNVVKCQGYSFDRFWGIKGKPTRGGGMGGKITVPTPPRLGLIYHRDWILSSERLQLSYFTVNIGKFLRTSSLKNICERLLLAFLALATFPFRY